MGNLYPGAQPMTLVEALGVYASPDGAALVEQCPEGTGTSGTYYLRVTTGDRVTRTGMIMMLKQIRRIRVSPS